MMFTCLVRQRHVDRNIDVLTAWKKKPAEASDEVDRKLLAFYTR